jgi:glycosyltransferase involved in cell wall biosynthesis
MDISVVIPTFNRSRLLQRSIPALANQKTGEYTYEVIFVSNGSTDETGEMLRAAAAEYPDRVRWFRIDPTGGPSAPRNKGIREARGNAVVILDDDVVPDEDLVYHHARFHAQFPEPQHAAVGELYVPEDMLRDPMSVFHLFDYNELRALERLDYLHFWTCQVSFKREFMLAHGMFDEEFLFFEDVLCGHKLKQAGMYLHFLPEARGQHLHQMKPGGVKSKGIFIGRWLYPFEQRVPERAVRERYGVFTTDLSPAVLLRRSLNRLAFQFVDNPVSLALLRLAGAENGRRTKVSDLYYYVVFRSHMLRGYRQAKREALAARGNRADKSWLDRGE